MLHKWYIIINNDTVNSSVYCKTISSILANFENLCWKVYSVHCTEHFTTQYIAHYTAHCKVQFFFNIPSKWTKR